MTPVAGGVRTCELAEWTSTVLEGVTLCPADTRLAAQLAESDGEGRLRVRELQSGVELQAFAWVGVVRFTTFEVRIVPKLAGGDLGLVDMIDFTMGLDALRRNASLRSLSAEGGGLFDLIALLFAEATESVVRKGLRADYVEREADLPVVRGRILVANQVLNRFGQMDRIACRYDEHEHDIPDNQLLAAALGVTAPRATHSLVRRRLRRLQAAMDGVCDPAQLDLAVQRSDFTYDRLNEHYRTAHGLAWLLLDGLGIRDVLTGGGTACFAFLIDMNRLFETFVQRLVERLLANQPVMVHAQRRDSSIIRDLSTNRPYSRVIPDLLIEWRGQESSPRVAVDAKYKLYDEKKLSPADVYQTFLYAFAYGQHGGSRLPRAVVLYPASTSSSQPVRLAVGRSDGPASAEILAMGISIPAALAELRDGQWNSTCAPVLEAVIPQAF